MKEGRLERDELAELLAEKLKDPKFAAEYKAAQARSALLAAVLHPPCTVMGGPDSCAPGRADRKHPECVLAAFLDPSNARLALRAMGVEGWELLNLYTKEILAEAAAVTKTLPLGWRLFVNASTGVLLNRDDGHWVGFSREGGQWHAYCGSLWRPDPDDPMTCFCSLAEAVCVFVEGDEG